MVRQWSCTPHKPLLLHKFASLSADTELLRWTMMWIIVPILQKEKKIQTDSFQPYFLELRFVVKSEVVLPEDKAQNSKASYLEYKPCSQDGLLRNKHDKSWGSGLKNKGCLHMLREERKERVPHILQNEFTESFQLLERLEFKDCT